MELGIYLNDRGLNISPDEEIRIWRPSDAGLYVWQLRVDKNVLIPLRVTAVQLPEVIPLPLDDLLILPLHVKKYLSFFEDGKVQVAWWFKGVNDTEFRMIQVRYSDAAFTIRNMKNENYGWYMGCLGREGKKKITDMICPGSFQVVN